MASEQLRQQFEADLAANSHELFVFSFQEMGEIIAKHPKGNLPQVRKAWAKIKKPAEAGANYYASADDTVLLAKLIGDLGGFKTKVYVRNYKGKPYIILKGNPGLRNILTGTRYSLHNAKVVKMGLGKAGAQRAIMAGGQVSIVLMAAFRVLDYILTDATTLPQTIGRLYTDVVKIGIMVGASLAAVKLAFGTMATLSFAIGPLFVAIVVGVLVGLALGKLDEHFKVTDRLVAALEEASKDAQTKANAALGKAFDSAIDYVFAQAATTAERIVWRQVDRFFTSRPRLR